MNQDHFSCLFLVASIHYIIIFIIIIIIIILCFIHCHEISSLTSSFLSFFSLFLSFLFFKPFCSFDQPFFFPVPLHPAHVSNADTHSYRC